MGREYHRGNAGVIRMREWRKANPEYSKIQRQRSTLRKALRRTLSSELANAIESCALQDLNDRQIALVLGIVSRITGATLQYQMAAMLRRLMFDGYALLGASESP